LILISRYFVNIASISYRNLKNDIERSLLVTVAIVFGHVSRRGCKGDRAEPVTGLRLVGLELCYFSFDVSVTVTVIVTTNPSETVDLNNGFTTALYEYYYQFLTFGLIYFLFTFIMIMMTMVTIIIIIITRNSSGDEIANVNFLYDDIAHALQNTIRA